MGLRDVRDHPPDSHAHPDERGPEQGRILGSDQMRRLEADDCDRPEHARDQPPAECSDRYALPVLAHRLFETKRRDVRAREPDRHIVPLSFPVVNLIYHAMP